MEKVPEDVKKTSPDQQIELNPVGKQLFNMNAKTYIEEKFPLAVVAQKKKINQQLQLATRKKKYRKWP